MGYKKIAPSLELSSFVDHFWILDVQQEELPFVHTILPFAWFELFFDLNDSSSDKAKYIGQLSKGYKIIHEKPYCSVGVSLKPNVANFLFQIPANKLTNSSVNWSDLDTESPLHAQLVVAKSEQEIINLLENYIFKKLKYYDFDEVSAYISQRIIHEPYFGINDSLLSSTSLSRRRVEQRFLASTGVSMGLFLRKTRFDSAIDCLCQNNSKSLTHIGIDLGYYDQAHFSREFKGFAGITPKKYRNTLQGMSELERLLQ